jgi:hypothetical protein
MAEDPLERVAMAVVEVRCHEASSSGCVTGYSRPVLTTALTAIASSTEPAESTWQALVSGMLSF